MKPEDDFEQFVLAAAVVANMHACRLQNIDGDYASATLVCDQLHTHFDVGYDDRRGIWTVVRAECALGWGGDLNHHVIENAVLSDALHDMMTQAAAELRDAVLAMDRILVQAQYELQDLQNLGWV